ncbi:MAG: hypothetical protein R3B51_11290 [Thermodesulfobacteriota bacterium]
MYDNYIKEPLESLIRFVQRDWVWFLILWGMLAGVLVTLAFFSISKRLDPDEIEHAHTTWLIWQGKEIYIDFFQHHHPFLSYMLVPVVNAFGASIETIMVERRVSAGPGAGDSVRYVANCEEGFWAEGKSPSLALSSRRH